MLSEDPRSYIKVQPDKIVALYEATNQPLVQPAGRTAQPAQAVVAAIGVRGGYETVVGLTLIQSGENVIYAGEVVSQNDLPKALEEALNFAESMGFILDATGWAKLDGPRRAELLDRLSAFWPPQRAASAPVEEVKPGDPLSLVARLFAAFAVVLGAAATAFAPACSGMSAEQRGQAAEIHYQLGDNLLHEGNAQAALSEYMQSLQLDETPEAHLGVGLIYAWSLHRPQDGEREFKRALEMRPDYSEAMTNLGALYISRGRFTDAIPPLTKAGTDPLYKARILAQSDLGWALYKSGQVDKGIGEIRAALTVAPKYCLGWRQLGTIYSEQHRLDDARAAFGKYVESCPEVLDAHLQSGKVLTRLSRATEARAAFERCAIAEKEKDRPIAAECARFLKELGSP